MPMTLFYAKFQYALNASYLYYEKWKLKENVTQTNIVIFSKNRQCEDTQFFDNNEEVTVIKHF